MTEFRKLTCIVCPIGCVIELEYDEDSVITIQGNLCEKGTAFAEKEIFNPERTLTTSVRIIGGRLPLASVRTREPIPKSKIFEVMEEIKKVRMKAPVRQGDVVLHDVAGTGVDVVVTRNIQLE